MCSRERWWRGIRSTIWRVLKVPVRNVPVQVLGDSSALKSGETVIALGSPLGLEGTVTSGVISKPERKVAGQTLDSDGRGHEPGAERGSVDE